MSPRKLIRTLRGAHCGGTQIGDSVRDRLEEELLQEHHRRYGKRTRRRTLLRPAFALPALAVVILGIGAIPASYPVAVGSVLTLALPPTAGAPPAVADLLQSLESAGAADDVSVSVSQRAGAGARLMLILIGSRVPEDDVVQQLRGGYPVLADARVTADPLVGSVRSSLAEKLGRALFPIEVSLNDVEEARGKILEELAAGGYGASRVDVRDEDDHRAIDVELEGRD
jgi:hypothetical protein